MAKYAFCLSSLRLSNGSTATLFSGIGASRDKTSPLGTVEPAVRTLAGKLRWRTKKKVATQRAVIAKTAAGHNQGVVVGSPKNFRGRSAARPPDDVAIGLSMGSWVVSVETVFTPPVSLAAGSG